MHKLVVAAALALTMAGAAAPARADAAADARAAEESFARSMAERDFKAFATHVADDAVFIHGAQQLHGKAAVLAFWQQFFKAPAAPFSWRPAVVVTSDGGRLAYSSGPVFAPDGRCVNTFASTWQLRQGRWQVVFDNGFAVCPDAATAPAAPQAPAAPDAPAPAAAASATAP